MSALPSPSQVAAYRAPVGGPAAQACPACGAQSAADARFCGQCGATLGPARALAPSVADPDDGLMRSAANRVTKLAGLGEIQRFSLSDLFSEAFKRRSYDEVEQHLLAGTRLSTPDVMAVSTDWPRPWLFARALAMALLLYGMFQLGWYIFGNSNLLPGLMITGAFVVPGAALILFYELNAPRNVSLLLVARLVLMGGALSLLISLVLFEVGANLSEMLGAASAGFIEETGKLAAVVFATRKLSTVRYRYTLNGLLFGAAVGTGFSAFETAGYAFNFLLKGGADNMTNIILVRGVLSPFGHTVWTAIAAAALWRIKGARSFKAVMLGEGAFLRLLLLAMACHFTWNASFELFVPFLKQLLLGGFAWVVAFSLVQDGLRQVKAEQRVAAGLKPVPEA